MTPATAAKMKDPWNLAPVLASAAALLTSVGYAVSTPKDQIAQERAAREAAVHAIEVRMDAQERTTDSLGIILRRVDALVQVKCVETKDRLVKQILACPAREIP